MAICILLRHLQEGCESLRRLMETGHVLRTLRRETRRIIPSNRDSREDRDIQCLVPVLTNLNGISTMLQIVTVKATHVVESHTIDTQAINQFL